LDRGSCVIRAHLFFVQERRKIFGGTGHYREMEKPAVYSFGVIAGHRFFLHAFIFSEIIQRPFHFTQSKCRVMGLLQKVAIGTAFVLMEEIIFRGYCLHKTVYKIGPVKANLTFCFLFYCMALACI
jgi:membrane protease YdiL (CAAX protease family)